MPKLNIRFRAVALLLCLLLAEIPGTILLSQTPTPPKLLITILDGEGALNNIKQRTAREPIIKVEDENHKPVAGAIVLLMLPNSGPSGTFLDGTLAYTDRTNANGEVHVKGMRPNQTSGTFQIQVTATYAGITAHATINQTNSSEPSVVPQHAAHAIPVKVIVIVAAAAAGGITAGILATQGGHSTSITAGTPTVAAPPQ
jgi:hypothetical protein